MTLKTFLETANSDDAIARDEARAYMQIEFGTINGNQAQQYFSLTGAMTRLRAAREVTNVIQVLPDVNTTVSQVVEAMLATMAIGNNGKFSADPSTEDGQANRAAAQALVNEGVLSQFEIDNFFAMARVITYPYQFTTLADVKIVRETLDYKPVQVIDGYAVITLNKNVEKHNPRLMADNPRTGQRIRVASFYGVSAKGIYETRIPNEWRNADLYVDDAYGAVI